MSRGRFRHILNRLCRAAAPPAGDEPNDHHLLERFVVTRDETAFEALLRRHGPMVLGVCRRVLPGADAADAFQATFLVLVRKAGSLDRRGSVGGWLHTVAHRIALRAREDAARRRRYEGQASAAAVESPSGDVSVRETRQAVDGELRHLPEKYRVPLVLCYLEGKTHDEAARQLGWSKGTVAGRLARARDLLRRRLERRGVGLSAAALATLLAEQTASGGVPAPLTAATLQAARLLALGESAEAAGVSVTAAALAERTLRTMFLARLRELAAIVLVLCAVTAGAGVLARQVLARRPPEAPAEPDGVAATRQAAPVDRYGDPLPPGALARMGTVRLREPEGSGTLAFTPDGKQLASDRSGGRVRFWDVTTGKEMRTIDGHGGGLGIAFSPDGKFLATVGGKTVNLCDAATGKRLHELPCELTRDIVTRMERLGGAAATFSPDGRKLAAVSAGHLVRVWDVATGRQLFQLAGHEQEVASVVFARDGRSLTTMCAAGKQVSVRVWDATTGTGKEERKLSVPLQPGRRLALAPGGKTLAVSAWATVRENKGQFIRVSTAYSLHLWDVGSGTERHQLEAQDNPIWAVAFSPDGTAVAWAGLDNRIRVADIATGRVRHRLPGHPGGTRPDGNAALAFAPGGQLLAVIGSGGVVHLWDLATGAERLANTEAHHGHVTALAYAPDGRTLFSVGGDFTVRGWHPATGRQALSLGGHGADVRSLAVSPDRPTLASVDRDHSLRLWDAATGKRIRAIQTVERTEGVYSGICPVAFSTDGQSLVTWGDDRALRRWDVATGKEMAKRPVQLSDLPPQPPGRPKEFPTGPQIQAVEFSPDGRLAAVLAGQTVYVLDVASGREVRKLAGVDSQSRVAFSADGGLIASAGWDKTVRLWEVVTGKLVWQSSSPEHFNAVALSPDGRLVAVASGWAGGKVHILDAMTGKELLCLQGHDSYVGALAFAPDGKSLASGQRDTTILVWDVTPALGKRQIAAEVGRAELDRLWADLADADAARGQAAVGRLIASPEKALAYLKDRLPPAPRVAPERLRQLVADLDSADFAAREASSKELSRLGREAEPALRAAVKESRSLEARRRAERILAEPELRAAASPEMLRRLRAVRVLEHLNSGPALALLRGLAGGAPGAAETLEAQDALGRLARTKW